MAVQILVGDCRELLAGLPAGRFHTCVTSPPYWGLRDYGTEPLEWPAITYSPLPGLPPCVSIPAMRCSLGLEPSLEAFIGHIVLVFREVRRALRDDGTLWLNMGDSYAGSRRGVGTIGDASTLEGPQTEHSRRALVARVGRNIGGGPQAEKLQVPRSDVAVPGLKPKDLMGQPWRVAFALQADGWWNRTDVIWHKLNPMPESASDRPTRAHEYVFLLTKSERYYYDADAVKEPASADTHARYARGRSESHKWAGEDPMPGQRQQTIAKGFQHMRKPVGGWASGAGDHCTIAHNQVDPTRHGKLITEPTAAALRKVAQRPDGAYEDGKSERMGRGPGWRKLADGRDAKSNPSMDAALAVMPQLRNLRTVWSISTEGYKEAHFATFPTRLVEPCIRAGSPEGGEVLDCFGGSATTGLVADRLGRNAVLCELNPKYAGMGKDRLAGDRGHVARQRGMELDHD